MRVIYHNWSATKQRPHPQSVAEISRHSVLSGDRIRQVILISDLRRRLEAERGQQQMSSGYFDGAEERSGCEDR